MDLDIYKKCGPAGASKLNLKNHTVNLIWFLELLKKNTTYKNRSFTILEIGFGAGDGRSPYKKRICQYDGVCL